MPRRRVLAIAVGLFVAIFVLRVIFPSPQSGIGNLYFLPVVVIALEYGTRAGLISALAAVVISQATTALVDTPAPLASYIPRLIGFVIVGGITGWMSDRLRRAAQALREGARHFELSGDLLCTADFEGNLVHLNDTWEQVLGWTPEEIMARPFLEFVHPDDREHTITENARVADNNATADFTNRYRAKDGSYRWLEWSSRADLDAGLVYAVARDVTDRHEAERAGREARERFRRIFDDSFAGIALVGLDGKILEANRGLGAFLGQTPEDLVGKQTLTGYVGDGQLQQIEAGVEKMSAGATDVYRDEIQVRRSDGRLVWVDLTMSMIRDDDGKPLYRLSQMLDIQARKEAEDQLRHLADHDPLSGVFNRRRFEVELEIELGHEAQHARSSAVLLFDIDDFKKINDSLGHGAGDAVIVRLGETLRNQVRSGDAVARLGGDEFAILLRRVDIAGAERIATKVRERGRVAMAQAIDSSTPIGLSVGIAMIDGASSASADVILGRADASMYEAKRRGGDRVVSRVAETARPDAATIG